MDGNNQGYNPFPGGAPLNNQQFQAPSFDQTSQEFYPQSQGGYQPPNQETGQHATPDGWFNQGAPQTDPFGNSQGYTQGSGYPLEGSQMPQDAFGVAQPHIDPFNNSQSNTDPFGGSQGLSQSYDGDLPLKWWQKGARVFLIGGVGVLVLSILVFTVATKLKNRPPKQKVDLPPEVNQQVDYTPIEEAPIVPETPTVPAPVTDNWQVVSNTDGYNYVETRTGEFIVKDLILYYKNNEGVQIRSAAVGVVDGYPGSYEVDLPRSAALFDKITVGTKFLIQFDVYKAADSPNIFIENLRPDR